MSVVTVPAVVVMAIGAGACANTLSTQVSASASTSPGLIIGPTSIVYSQKCSPKSPRVTVL
jgi:hypothetical protein